MFYVWVTNNLTRSLYEHKNKILDGFIPKYNIHKIIFYQEFCNIKDAIENEKRIKKWSRNKKVNLINISNPTMKELSM